jgi:chromosome segregation ATPase
MYRINFLLAGLGLFVVGCSESAEPTAENPSTSPTTVTANKPVPGEAASTGEVLPGSLPTGGSSLLEQTQLPDGEPQGEDKAERVKREFGEAGEALADWSAGTKEALIEKAEQRLSEFDDEIAQLERKSQDLKDDAKVRWEEDKQRLEEKRREISQQLDELKDSSGGAWEKMSQGIVKAFIDLKEAAKEAASEFE